MWPAIELTHAEEGSLWEELVLSAGAQRWDTVVFARGSNRRRFLKAPTVPPLNQTSLLCVSSPGLRLFMPAESCHVGDQWLWAPSVAGVTPACHHTAFDGISSFSAWLSPLFLFLFLNLAQSMSDLFPSHCLPYKEAVIEWGNGNEVAERGSDWTRPASY